MNNTVIIYIGIFTFKIIEEALKTLRIIVIANGKKNLGAILQFFVTLAWIVVTSYVIMDIKKDPFKIIVYCIGSLVGSYIGSFAEEKIAIGTNVLMVEINENIGPNLIKELTKYKYKVNVLKSNKPCYEVLMITSPRKKSSDVINIIRSFDEKANIISEKAKITNS